ncbi:hypothetical protein D3C71_925580 [compost metagenome]
MIGLTSNSPFSDSSRTGPPGAVKSIVPGLLGLASSRMRSNNQSGAGSQSISSGEHPSAHSYTLPVACMEGGNTVCCPSASIEHSS